MSKVLFTELDGGSAVAEDWVQRYFKRTAKQGDPLAQRRVRAHADGRTGVIERAHYSHRGKADTGSLSLGVCWDDEREGRYGRPTRYESSVDLSTVEILPAPALTAPVRVRKVILRGTKGQVAQRWIDLGLDDPESERRQEADWYVEFQPDVAAYRRWRIVRIGPPKDPAEVAEIPSEHPRAVAERKSRKESVEYGEPDGYGF